ncbi:MAG: FixH family protein [Deltaproteobacteria bacterium]|nr:FixH family protein [Deltaproteobacteria bacterium]
MICCARIKFFSVIFGLLCWFTAGLQAGPVFPASSGQNIPEITVEKKSPEYTWILKTPGKPGLVQISLFLRHAGGSPVKQRSVTGEVWMPEMPMPGYPLALEFKEAEDGEYVALAQYGHGGFWQVKAQFKDDNDRLFQQSFDLDIANQP